MMPGLLKGRAAVWEQQIREAPLGVLVLSMVLGLLGAGIMIAGVYLGLSRPGAGWGVWLGAVAAGPLILFVGLRLLSLAPWTWATLVMLLVLLLISSCIRAVMTPGIIPAVPAVEIALELLALLYLATPAVRRAFGRLQLPEATGPAPRPAPPGAGVD